MPNTINHGRGILGLGVSPHLRMQKAIETLKAPESGHGTKAKKRAAETFVSIGGTLAELEPLIASLPEYQQKKILARALKNAPAEHPDHDPARLASRMADLRLDGVEAARRAGSDGRSAYVSALRYVKQIPVHELSERQALFRATARLESAWSRGDTESEKAGFEKDTRDAWNCTRRALELQAHAGRGSEIPLEALGDLEASLRIALSKAEPRSSAAPASAAAEGARTALLFYRKDRANARVSAAVVTVLGLAAYGLPSIPAALVGLNAHKKVTARGVLPVRVLEHHLGIDHERARELMTALADLGVFGSSQASRKGMPGFSNRVVEQPLTTDALRRRNVRGELPPLPEGAHEKLADLLKVLHEEARPR